MKYARFVGNNGKIHYGSVEGENIRIIKGDIFADFHVTNDVVPISSIKLLAPCEPTKIVGAGANYHSFIEKKGIPVPEQPKLYIKPSTSIANPGDEVLCPSADDTINYEGELGVVIGRTCKNVSKQDALKYVFGYTCVNDVTDITMMQADVQWDRGKSIDTFLPCGPFISDSVNCSDVMITTKVDGELRQKMSTSDMVFNVADLIEFISKYITLCPGDVIATGSPAGAGRYQPGQTVSIEIEGIGLLENTMARPNNT